MIEQERVEVLRPWVGLCTMQVCAVKDATDEEILEVCNRENPSGTSNGWSQVKREHNSINTSTLPVKCDNDPNRRHFIIVC